MRKYWRVLQVAVAERMVYRANFFVASIIRFMPMVTTIFLWSAIFESSGRTKIADYTRESMIGYYLLTMVARSFSSMPGLASTIAREIREGQINRYLVRPIDYQVYLLTLRVAHKLVHVVTAFVPFGVVIYLMRGFFPETSGYDHLVFGVASLLLGFAIGFLYHCLIGFVGFWMLEVNSFLFIVMVSEYFLSGQMFPLDVLEGGAFEVLRYLPFAYECYYPVRFLMGLEDDPAQMIHALCVQIAWVAILTVACRWALRRGLRRYGAYGG